MKIIVVDWCGGCPYNKDARCELLGRNLGKGEDSIDGFPGDCPLREPCRVDTTTWQVTIT